MFLRCAVAAGAKYIISGDRHLLHLKSYKRIKILSPAEFLYSVIF
jgi:predicted nucleic acid-binding protein